MRLLMFIICWLPIHVLGGITGTFEFSTDKVIKEILNNGSEKYTSIKYDGMIPNPIPGEVILPIRIVSYALPKEAGEVTLTVQSSNSKSMILPSKIEILNNGFNIEENASLKIISDSTVVINDLWVANGGKLEINAPKIECNNIEYPFWHAEATIIFNGVNQTKKINTKQISDTSDNLIDEGKTWWYEGRYMASRKAEVGITVGGLSDLYDGTWHEVRVTTGLYYPNLNTEPDKFEKQDLNELIALVKEEDGCLKSRYVVNNNFTGAMGILEDVGWPGFLHYYERLNYDVADADISDKVFTIHLNGNIGDQFKIGEGQASFDAKIDSIEDIENSGRSYRKYTCSVPENDFTYMSYGSDKYIFIPQIGVTEQNWAQVFFAPVFPILEKTAWDAELRYVTDKDNKIIYTGKGGAKAWDLTDSGYNDICSDAQTAQPEYFNLQGVRLANPSAGQFVIARQGNKATKTIVK